MKFLVLSLLISIRALAGLGEDFRDLKDSAVDYEVVGAVCEEVTRLRFEHEFPANRYHVVTGIEYNDGNRTIGELDVVVFEAASQKVVRVAEVKCWRNTRGALAKAQEQRRRFLNYLQSGRPMYFNSLHSNYKWKKDNFVQNKEFMTVAQQGSSASGFDRELEYSLEDLMKLRKMMLDCQAAHQCAAPARH